MIVTIHDPLAEPMIHRDFPGGFEELQEYVMEVCEGIKDHCVRDPNDPDRHPLGIHLPPAAVRLRVPDARADRPDRAHLPAIGRHALHAPGPGDHLEGLGGQRLLRSGLPAEHLVPDHPRRRPAAAEHERPLPLERRLQGGLHEHVRPGAVCSRGSPRGSASCRASRSRWAATATWPTAFTSTARTCRSSRPDSWARFEKRTLRAADDALRGRARDDGSGPAGDPRKGPQDGALIPAGNAYLRGRCGSSVTPFRRPFPGAAIAVGASAG